MNEELVTVRVVQTCPKCGTDEVYHQALVPINEPSEATWYGGDWYCKDCHDFSEYVEAWQITASEIRPGMAVRYSANYDWSVVKSVDFTKVRSSSGYEYQNMTIEHFGGWVKEHIDPHSDVFLRADERLFKFAGYEWVPRRTLLSGVDDHQRVVYLAFNDELALKEVAS